jgi:hypothetical protein
MREALWHEDLNVFANELVACPTEESFSMRIYQHDAALIVDQNCAARRSLGHQVKKFLGLFPLRDIH